MTNEPNTAAIEAKNAFMKRYPMRSVGRKIYEDQLFDARSDAFFAGYEAAKAAEWVKVSERLPDRDDWFEVTVSESATPKPFVSTVAFNLKTSRWRCGPTCTVIAWRERPQPYAGE